MPRLLVIDDESSVCYSFRRVFGARGVDVATAGTGEAGLQQLREQRPDVIVLDLQLPDGSGLDVFETIARSDARCRSSSSPRTAPPTPPSRR